MSTTCLGQVDLTNRCNLTCPVCFASANQAGYLSEPTFEMVVEMLRALRDQKPVPASAVQFTGGEPTLHPDFFRILETAREMGFAHVQCASNGVTLAEPGFAENAAAAGLQLVYLQFDGIGRLVLIASCAGPRSSRPSAPRSRRAAAPASASASSRPSSRASTTTRSGRSSASRWRTPTSVNGIAYQPVSFSGRISRHELEAKRYTLGDLAAAVAAETGADVHQDFFPPASPRRSRASSRSSTASPRSD